MNYDEIREELKREKEEINRKIKEFDEVKRIINSNTFESIFSDISVVAMQPYMVVFVILMLISKMGNVTLITNIIPAKIVPILLVGSSFGIGAIARNFMVKKFKLKERFKKFSDAKNEGEKLIDEIRAQIELEKLINRNKVIDEIICLLNQPVIDNDSSKDEDSIKRIIEALSLSKEEQYKKLDIFSEQKVLHERFWRVRSKWQRNADMMVYPSLIGMFTMFMFGFPFYFLNEVIIYSSLFENIAMVFGPLIMGIGGTLSYMLNRNKLHKSIFKRFNNELSKDALSQTLDDNYEMAYNEQQEINNLISKLVSAIGLVSLQLRQKECVLRGLGSTDAKSKGSVVGMGIPPIDHSLDLEGNPHVKGRTVDK